MSSRVARAIVLGMLRDLHGGELRLVESGRQTVLGAPSSLLATVTIRDPRAWSAVLRGSFGLAASYRDGWWDCDDLVALTRIAARNVHRLDRLRTWIAPVWHPVQRTARRVHAPTIGRSRRQIAAHYDLGNDLFALFLDETMSYSAGFFETPSSSLHEASVAKLDRVCRKLDLGPDEHLLEIGSGWGALAVHAAGNYGCRVTTITISKEQHALAIERVRAAGLEHRVTVLLQDYRELGGTYDKLVSIEMIEAVGWQFFDAYFRRCSELLEPHGAMLLQAITIDDRAYEVEKGGRSFSNTLIFPGGCLPSLEVIGGCVARETDMRPVEIEDMTPDYVRTLAAWRTRFAAASERLEKLGYDERFRRLWNFYLSYSQGGFAERRIQVAQHLLAKPRFSVRLRAAGTESSRRPEPGSATAEPARAFAAGAQSG